MAAAPRDDGPASRADEIGAAGRRGFQAPSSHLPVTCRCRTSVDARAYILYYRWHGTGELRLDCYSKSCDIGFCGGRRAPIDPGEIRRTERWLATARVFLAISALVAVRMDPGEIGYSFWAYGLLAFYIAQGVVVILLLRRREQSTVSFRRLVHAADIVWPALISIFATGQPTLLFFVFVLAPTATGCGGVEETVPPPHWKFRCCGWRAT